MRRELAARAEKASNPTPLVDWETTRDVGRLALPDPDADLAALPLVPLPPVDALAARRRELEAELQPAGRDTAAIAVRALSKTMKIPGDAIIADENWEAFTDAMIGALAGYSSAVLRAAVGEAVRTLEWFPATATMVKICDEQVARRRDELRAITNVDEERNRRCRVEKAKRDRLRENEKYLERLAATLGDGALSPDDIGRAQRLRPILWCGGRMVAWTEGMREPWAPQLVRRLVLIARLDRAAQHGQCSAERAVAIAHLVVDNEASVRDEIEQIEAVAGCGPAPGESPDLEAAIGALEADAGLDNAPPRTRRLRPLEPDTAPRRLGEIFATLDIGAIGAPLAEDR